MIKWINVMLKYFKFICFIFDVFVFGKCELDEKSNFGCVLSV